MIGGLLVQRITSPAGGIVSYDQYGSGPPLVLVHGGFSDHHTNWEFVRPLFEQRFSVYSIRVLTFYAVVLGLTEAGRDDDHMLLESPGFQMVVHRMMGRSAAPEITVPPARRATAAFKPVFFVRSISRLRGVVEEHGGAMEPADREWSFNGVTVCDALDPEGNVIQFREDAR